MKHTQLLALLTLCSIANAVGGPSKVEKFDAEKKSVNEMLLVVKERIAAGEDKAVLFPSGQ